MQRSAADAAPQAFGRRHARARCPPSVAGLRRETGSRWAATSGHRSAAPRGQRSGDTGVCRCDIAHPRSCPSTRLRARNPENGCSGRGERSQTSTTDLNVPVSLPLEIALTGMERGIDGDRVTGTWSGREESRRHFPTHCQDRRRDRSDLRSARPGDCVGGPPTVRAADNDSIVSGAPRARDLATAGRFARCSWRGEPRGYTSARSRSTCWRRAVSAPPVVATCDPTVRVPRAMQAPRGLLPPRSQGLPLNVSQRSGDPAS
jgi:hypothetical protein